MRLLQSMFGLMPDLIQVALPLPLEPSYTYRISSDQALRAQPGCRALVPFGKRMLMGVIVPDQPQAVPPERVRDILDLPDAEPLLPPDILELCRWISHYYFCSWGEALKAALPAGHLQADGRIALRQQEFIRPADEWNGERLRDKSLVLASKAPQQAQILQFLSDHPQIWATGDLLGLAGVSRSALKSLIKAGVLIAEMKRVKRYPSLEALSARDEAPLPQPNSHQCAALEAISVSLKAEIGKTFLLFGVTGSGKTLVYQKAAEMALEMGGTALVLVPEISLTPQMVGRFRAHFGDRVGLQHSAMSPGERIDVWQGIRAGEFPLVLGVRSAVFAPLCNLRLIIVDEEGDTSFKQNEPNPRYHARDVALMRAKMCGATSVLGSATPSLESFFNAERGRFITLNLPERVDGLPLPRPRFEQPAKSRDRVLGPALERAVKDRLQRGEQTILLQNRRGFYTYIFCSKCGHISRCKHCAIALTLHRRGQPELRCHICGYRDVPLRVCPECGSPLRYSGIGTQRVEEDLAKMTPEDKIVRLDMDTTGRKGSHQRILKGFAGGDYAIMVGTKMVARGHDYPRVTLVGVISADTELAFPDFRSDERAFALLLQATGRAGRANHQSPAEVIIQSWMPDHPVLKLVEAGDYRSFYQREISLRRQLNWPPWGWLVLFGFTSRQENKAVKAAGKFLELARKRLPDRQWLGPTAAYRAKLKDKYRFHVLLKAPREYRSIASEEHNLLRGLISDFRQQVPSSVHFFADVDPVQLL